jgi:uncharacterized protein YqhQ
MDFVLFVVIVAILVYNFIQVLRASNGKRLESEVLLLFCAAFIDIYHLFKK